MASVDDVLRTEKDMDRAEVPFLDAGKVLAELSPDYEDILNGARIEKTPQNINRE